MPAAHAAGCTRRHTLTRAHTRPRRRRALLHNWLYFLALGLAIPVLPRVVSIIVNPDDSPDVSPASSVLSGDIEVRAQRWHRITPPHHTPGRLRPSLRAAGDRQDLHVPVCGVPWRRVRRSRPQAAHCVLRARLCHHVLAAGATPRSTPGRFRARVALSRRAPPPAHVPPRGARGRARRRSGCRCCTSPISSTASRAA